MTLTRGFVKDEKKKTGVTLLTVQVFLGDFFDSKCCDCTGSNREGGELGGTEG